MFALKVYFLKHWFIALLVTINIFPNLASPTSTIKPNTTLSSSITTTLINPITIFETTTQQQDETTSILTTIKIDPTIITETKEASTTKTITLTSQQTTIQTPSTLTDINTNQPITVEPTSIYPTDSHQTTSSAIKSSTTTSTSFPYLFMDFCPGVGKNIDCLNGELIQIVDAFYGVSEQQPSVCSFKYFQFKIV